MIHSNTSVRQNWYFVAFTHVKILRGESKRSAQRINNKGLYPVFNSLSEAEQISLCSRLSQDCCHCCSKLGVVVCCICLFFTIHWTAVYFEQHLPNHKGNLQCCWHPCFMFTPVIFFTDSLCESSSSMQPADGTVCGFRFRNIRVGVSQKGNISGDEWVSLQVCEHVWNPPNLRKPDLCSNNEICQIPQTKVKLFHTDLSDPVWGGAQVSRGHRAQVEGHSIRWRFITE